MSVDRIPLSREAREALVKESVPPNYRLMWNMLYGITAIHKPIKPDNKTVDEDADVGSCTTVFPISLVARTFDASDANEWRLHPIMLSNDTDVVEVETDKGTRQILSESASRCGTEDVRIFSLQGMPLAMAFPWTVPPVTV